MYACMVLLQVARADRKEVRFFTRGEFADHAPPAGFMGKHESIKMFARHHEEAASRIEDGEQDTIVVDGGPHTLWSYLIHSYTSSPSP